MGCKITQFTLNLHHLNESFFTVEKEKESFAPQSLTREVVQAPFRLRTYRFIRKILLGFIAISIVNLLFSHFFYTPKMHRILSQNRELHDNYRILSERIRTQEERLREIRHRDNFVYRPLFAADTLAVEGIETPYPATKYAAWQHDRYAREITAAWTQIDAFARHLYQASVSLDELQTLSRNKENLSTALPAIWPIDRARLHGSIGAFNPRRMHPILHYVRPHKGVDLGGRRGDPVYATGDATVEMTDNYGGRRGYGRQILLDHQFGYKTRYAHLSKILVKPGDKVVRGQVIGELGNTGISSGPHLHYEVIYQGRPVNPINYFDKNMTSEEYEKLMENIRETRYERLE